MNRLLPSVILIILCGSAYSQTTTPGQLLRLARSTYEQGRLHEIESQLKPIFTDTRTTKAEKVEGYKILCQSYIYLEEPEKADEAMLNILRTDPYFQINEAVDPAEFVALYRTFRTDPIYRIGAKLGVNATRPNVRESVTAVELSSDSEYKYLIGIQFGATADLPFSKKITLHGELNYQQKRFEIDMKVDRGADLNGENQQNSLTGLESQTWLSLPITAEYLLAESRYNPYVSAGVAVDYLLASNITSERQRDNQQSIEQKKYEFTPNREKMNISIIAAAGTKLKLAGGYFVAEVRFSYGLTNVNSKETAFSNASFTLDQGYADSIFNLNTLSLTGSYIHNIFNPKKLTRRK
jgi:hypothetical protein